MAYPESCFESLIGIRNICGPVEAMYWVDDVPGIDVITLANVASSGAPTGEKLGKKLINAAARYMAADVEAIYDAQYKVQNQLVGGCSLCSFTGNYSAGAQRGILIKNNSDSSFARLVIDVLKVKTNSAGTFTINIDDGTTANLREIEYDFEAGVEYEFTNLNYQTKRKEIKVYFQEDTVLLAQLSCPKTGSGCGCSGSSAVVSDLGFYGMTDGLQSQNAYGFLPCAMIRCDAEDLLCFIAHSAPRMIGMALVFKVAELYFQTKLQTTRNNKIAGTYEDDTKEDVAKYAKLYTNKLNGKETRGVKDLVFTTLQQTHDACIVCNSLIGTAWATG